MAFFPKIVSDFVKTTISSINPYKVEEVAHQNILNDGKNYIEVDAINNFILYKVANHYELIYVNHMKDRTEKSKVFSLFRHQGSFKDAQDLHRSYYKVVSLLENCFAFDKMDKVWLEKVCSATRAHPNWTAAHVAASLELMEAFRQNCLSGIINTPDKETGATPLHLAVSSGNVDLVKEILLIDNVDLTLFDNEEKTVLHLAAGHETHHILNLLVNKSSICVNCIDINGRSPLHVACEAKSLACVDILLRFGADPSFSSADEFPIHTAMRVGSLDCVKILCEYFPDHVRAHSPKTGNTALHMVNSKAVLEALIAMGADVNARDHDGLTCLHLMVKNNDFEMVLAFLLAGADTNITTNLNETPLHFAIKDCDVDIIRSLIVFEVDVNAKNANGETARHLLCKNITNKYSHSKTKDIALYTIHAVGAKRCHGEMENCTNGCCEGGTFDGKSPTLIHNTMDHAKDVLDETLSAAHIERRSEQFKSKRLSILKDDQTSDTFPLFTQEDFENDDSDWFYLNQGEAEANFVKRTGIRLLCLDGGGIRGLILSQTLRALEKVSNRSIVDMFDWIGGTSTGGLLAISIVYKVSLKDCRIMYMKMKDNVFVGKRPYSTDYFEKIVKDKVGKDTVMTSVTYPKLTVTALLCDRFPPKLHLFRNYEPPLSGLKTTILQRNESENKNERIDSFSYISGGTHDSTAFSKAVRHPSKQLVWEAAKATGAAPTFFRACGPFLDGGLIANNPTLDMLAEICEYNIVRKYNNEPEEPLGIVVSLGTGRMPITPTSTVDVFRPNNPLDVYNIVQGVSVLTKIIVEMATSSEGRVVDRARAWCSSLSVPFFRFSPPLSVDTSLDEIDNKIILQMLWDTEAYLYRSQDRLKNLAELL